MSGYADLVGLVLDKTAGTISTEFVRSTLFPLAAAAVVNAGVWHVYSGVGMDQIIAGDDLLQTGSALALLVAVIAFTWNALLPAMRGLLRGRYWFPFAETLRSHSRKTKEAADRRLAEIQQAQTMLAGKTDDWIDEMVAARHTGVASANLRCDGGCHQMTREIRALRDLDPVDTSGRLGAVVIRFCELLKAHSANTNPALHDDHKQLTEIVLETPDRLAREASRQATWIQFQFPQAEFAPTRFGNVTRTTASYAETRYGLNFDFFWSKLRARLDESSDKALREAQSEMDFFVSLTFLAAFSTLSWQVFLLIVRGHPWAFLAISAIGPLLTYGCYAMAVRMNMTFAELVRNTLDVERHKVFDALRLRRPETTEQEEAAWTALNQWLAYGESTPYRFKNDP